MDVRDEVAKILGWEQYAISGAWQAPNNGPRYLKHPIPHPSDDRCLSWCVARIREAGWEWTKTYNGFLAHDCKETGHAGPIQTGNDAIDALHLLREVLRAKATDARISMGEGKDG